MLAVSLKSLSHPPTASSCLLTTAQVERYFGALVRLCHTDDDDDGDCSSSVSEQVSTQGRIQDLRKGGAYAQLL